MQEILIGRIATTCSKVLLDAAKHGVVLQAKTLILYLAMAGLPTLGLEGCNNNRSMGDALGPFLFCHIPRLLHGLRPTRAFEGVPRLVVRVTLGLSFSLSPVTICKINSPTLMECLFQSCHSLCPYSYFVVL